MDIHIQLLPSLTHIQWRSVFHGHGTFQSLLSIPDPNPNHYYPNPNHCYPIPNITTTTLTLTTTTLSLTNHYYPNNNHYYPTPNHYYPNHYYPNPERGIIYLTSLLA